MGMGLEGNCIEGLCKRRADGNYIPHSLWKHSKGLRHKRSVRSPGEPGLKPTMSRDTAIKGAQRRCTSTDLEAVASFGTKWDRGV